MQIALTYSAATIRIGEVAETRALQYLLEDWQQVQSNGLIHFLNETKSM